MARSCRRALGVPAIILIACSFAVASQTRVIDTLATPGTWKPAPWNKAPGQAQVSSQFPAHLVTGPEEPRQSLALTIDWPGGDEFRFFSVEPTVPQSPIPFQVLQVSVWLKGSGTGQSVEMNFAGADGKDVKVGLGSMDFSEWRKVRAKIPASAVQPLTPRSITIHNWGLTEKDKVVCYFARLQVTFDLDQPVAAADDAPALRIQALAPNGLVGQDGQASVRLAVSSWLPEPQRLELRHSVADWSGQTRNFERVPVTLTGQWSHEVKLETPRYGPYTYRAELWKEGGQAPVASAEQRLIRPVPVPVLSMAERANSPIGVNTHVAAAWEALGKCGIHWARDYSWGWLGLGQTAPTGNGLDFAGVWEAADSAGVTILPINQAAFRNEEGTAFIEDAQVIESSFRRLGEAFPATPYWELDNEAEYNFPSRRFDEDNYENLIANAAKGLRAAGKAQVVLNGTAGIRYDDTVQLLASAVRDDFTVVNYHYYTGTIPPEIARGDINVGAEDRRESLSFLDQIKRINRISHEAGKEAWLTEIGWDVSLGPAVGERLQAVYLPRVYLLASWCGTDKTFWYFDRDVEGSKTKFGSCGLLDLSQTLRPSAAAMAALSKHTALARCGGRIELGDDQWCLLFQHPGGEWVAAAWSVQREHPVPPELASADAFDIFGNSFKPAKLTPEVAYFRLAELPPLWDAQRQVEWLSPDALFAVSGQSAEVQLRGANVNVRWEPLPAGITASEWEAGDATFTSRLTCTAAVAPGKYPVKAVAAGEGWQKTWLGTFQVLPAAYASAPPYLVGEQAKIEVRSASDAASTVALSAAAEQGAIGPQSLPLQPRGAGSVAFTPADGASGAIPVRVAPRGAAASTLWLRPLALNVPRADAITIDGDLSDWAALPVMDANWFARSAEEFGVEARLAWNADGLLIAASIPEDDLQSADPRAFWDWTSLEIFAATGDGPGAELGSKTHQFWFCPVKDGDTWRLYAGEWKRSEAIEATVYDDTRCKTALKVLPARVDVEVLVPFSALGTQAPSPGAIWRGGLTMQSIPLGQRVEAAWPRAKDDGLLKGPDNWGRLTFIAAE